MNPNFRTRIAITACAVSAVATVLFLNYRWSLQHELDLIASNYNSLLHGSLHVVEAYLGQPGLEIDLAFRAQIIQELSSHPHISKVHISNSDGLILHSTVATEIGSNWIQNDSEIRNLRPVADSSRFQTFQNSDSIHVALQRLCTESMSVPCEMLYLEADSGYILQQARRDLLGNMFAFGLATVLCVIAILYMLQRRIFLPVRRTIANLDDFADGDHNLRCSPSGTWELRSLVHSVNKLFDHIQLNEKSLLEKQTMYAALLETMGDGLITLQPDGNIVSVNGAAERLLGFKRRELSGTNISKVFAELELDASEKFSLQKYVEENSSEKTDSHWEVSMRCKDGATIPVRMSIRNMIIDDKETYICVIGSIADIKKMEKELLELNRQLSHTNEQLEKSVITDSLTGLFNRRHFDTTFGKELARTTRQDSALSLLIVDIDFFKQYNDRYGHLLGDDCLSRVGEAMTQLFQRGGDLPARYGGEEFAVVLPGCDEIELQERAETLRTRIESLGMPHAGSKVSDVVTVSIGAITYKPSAGGVVAPNPRELFKEADRALYKAKANGRNRVEFAGLYQSLHIPGHTRPLTKPSISR